MSSWIWDNGVTTPFVALATIVSVNVIIFLARSFKRKGEGSFSNIVTGSVSLLSNKDSVLQRGQVANSMDGYDSLFTGARKEVGSLHKDESIRQREKEYKTMVSSFYDLVTDFYEYGWSQVNGIVQESLSGNVHSPHLFVLAIQSRSISLLERRGKRSWSPSSVLNII